jgi:hypothetical protein
LNCASNEAQFIANYIKEIRHGTVGRCGKIVGTVVAVEGAKKLDPNASILTEGADAVAGFEGAGAIVDHFEKNNEDNDKQS